MNKTLDQHNYNGIDATIIADSKNEFGNRITTFIVTFPRMVLAEFNTHRMLSRNSASSRAVPFEKMLDKVMKYPFVPLRYQKDHTGMQGTEYFNDEHQKMLDTVWLDGRDNAVQMAKNLSFGVGHRGDDGVETNEKVTKQLCNRLLEPFMWHTAIVTATEWQNFFALRAHPAAEIHIAKLAEVMLEQYNESDPEELKAGQWHIPFGNSFEHCRIVHSINEKTIRTKQPLGDFDTEINNIKIQVATARCARVSYLNFEGKDDYEADIRLHKRLADMGHWSPFEHCAQAVANQDINVIRYNPVDSNQDIQLISQWASEKESTDFRTIPVLNGCILDTEEMISGNFKGFVQYRKTFQGENKSDDRVIDKN